MRDSLLQCRYAFLGLKSVKKCQFRKPRKSSISARSVNHFTLGQPSAAHRLDRNKLVHNKKIGLLPTEWVKTGEIS